MGSINPTLEPKQLTANCIYHEIGGFKVEYKNNVSINLNGDVVYNFVITGLSTEMLYAVDVIPNVNILTPNIGYVLTKSGHAQNGFCNNSTVNGQALKIKISAVNPPK